MTGAQMKMYRALVAKAARARDLHSRGDVEAYRLEVLFEETGKRSSKEISSQCDFEAVMRRLAADAEDWELAAHFCAAHEQRIGQMANDCARQIIELSVGKDILDSALYIQRILFTAGFSWGTTCAQPGDWWKDCPPDTVKFIFCVLDKHRRRMVQRIRMNGGKKGVPLDAPLRFVFGASWRRDK